MAQGPLYWRISLEGAYPSGLAESHHEPKLLEEQNRWCARPGLGLTRPGESVLTLVEDDSHERLVRRNQI